MGALADAAGVFDPDRWGGSREANLRALNHEAAQFLRAGGRVSVVEWAQLSDEEKAALAVAGDKLAHRAAVLAGRAARSVRGELEVLAPLDEGEALIGEALSELLHREGM